MLAAREMQIILVSHTETRLHALAQELARLYGVQAEGIAAGRRP
uniref:Uncharacterized protein n=1 Tax=Thermosporothrix sp. COM3 TaxID=2490863 RepID=A0A455SGU2_9CHLR|nr:hypothetical protein KTC_01060 [Thermosporothrix sp. COM3]